MHRVIVIFVVVLLSACARINASNDPVAAASDIKSDETVVFFRTAGWLNAESQEWHLPVHGWIYEPEDSDFRLAAIEKVLEEKFDLSVTKSAKANFTRRVNLLLADNERGKTIIIKIADRVVELPTSTENGHFESIIVISADDVAEHVDDGFIHFTAVTRGTESRVFGGTIRLLGPDGLSVISDIDDTVKVSYVTHRKSLLEHTFLLDFVAAPGMSERYRDWASNDMGFHFVSSSPWHLYEPLSEFLDQNDFPWATFSLKSIRFRDETLLDLFKKGTETKPAAIKKILDRYPERQFVLIGDSGEQDPEVYAALLRERPQQILKVYIRLITREHAGNERFKRVFDGIDPDCWQLFEDPSTLGLPSER